MLPSTCSRETLIACPPFPPSNLPSFMVESTLSTPCSRSNPPHSRQGAALAHLGSLPPHDLVLWTDGSVPFPFGKGGSGVLANCSFCGTEATLFFSAGPVCSSFSAEACTIVFCFICHIYPPFTRKRIVSLYFGPEVHTRWGVAFFEVYGPPVFHIKTGRPVKCLAQGHNKRTCRLVLHNLP